MILPGMHPPLSRLIVGPGAALRPRLWTRGLSRSARLILVSEPRVWRLHGAKVRGALARQGLRVGRHLLPRGEKAKDLQAVARLLSAMLRQGLGRDSALAALGGGTVTDAAGFAAAIYMRGIPWVSLPTTLLGQIDGGVGGKTAVDLPEGKNLAGAFHQPLWTVCDTSLLATLPERELICGLAEALKLGLACDAALWGWLRKRWPDLLAGEPKALDELVRRAAAGKERVVSRDPRETRGLRDVLNFGHTIGHALEAAAGLGPLLHGEAVLCGMRAALRLSQAQGLLPERAAEEADAFLRGVPVPRLRLREAAVLAALRRDKKARRGRLRFVLLRAPGRAVVSPDVPEAAVRAAVRRILEELR